MEVITITRIVQVRAFIISSNNAHIAVTESIEIQGYPEKKQSSLVSQEALVEFKHLYMNEYGIELDNATALVKANQTLLLVKAAYKPIKKSEENKLITS